jgi:predicted DNA-binding protein (MmcQ/YjbR family)
MNVESVREYCLKMKACTEGFPFDENTLVMKVAGKMFALINLDENPSVNLKCDPEKAIELREEYEAVLPGYHMSKKHWNTVLLDGTVPDKMVKQWIEDSYQLVVSRLPKSTREEYGL